MIPPL